MTVEGNQSIDQGPRRKRRKPNYMPERGKSWVAGIMLDVINEAIRRLAGTNQATPEGFAQTIRELSTTYTDPNGVIDKIAARNGSGIGPRIREKIREAVIASASTGADSYTRREDS